MKKILHILFFICFSHYLIAQDTFSIIATDPVTGEIGSAAASCVPGVNDPNFIDWLTAIIPNRGGVMSQAAICTPNPNLQNAIAQMDAGLSPSEIIDYLIANDACAFSNFNPEYRQYGIVDFFTNINDDIITRTAGFTGDLNEDYAEDRQGTNFSIQGNILLDVSVINNMEANFNNTEGTLADKLMAALQGANFPGADSRCLEFGTSSRLAFLTVFRPDDLPSDPYIRLVVTSQQDGVEPIDLLQNMYDNLLSLPENDIEDKIKVFPNPATNDLTIKIHNSEVLSRLLVSDILGKKVIEKSKIAMNGLRFILDISDLENGVYFLQVTTRNGLKIIKFIKN